MESVGQVVILYGNPIEGTWEGVKNFGGTAGAKDQTSEEIKFFFPMYAMESPERGVNGDLLECIGDVSLAHENMGT